MRPRLGWTYVRNPTQAVAGDLDFRDLENIRGFARPWSSTGRSLPLRRESIVYIPRSVRSISTSQRVVLAMGSAPNAFRPTAFRSSAFRTTAFRSNAFRDPPCSDGCYGIVHWVSFFSRKRECKCRRRWERDRSRRRVAECRGAGYGFELRSPSRLTTLGLR